MRPVVSHHLTFSDVEKVDFEFAIGFSQIK